MMKVYKAVIFDFDGVIKDSVHVKKDAFVALYHKESVEFQDRVAQYHLAHGGVSRYEKFRVWNGWLGRPNDSVTLDEMASEFAQIVVNKVVESHYVPGILECFKSKGDSTKYFIATGTPDDEINDILNRLELTSVFTDVFGSSQSKVEIVRKILDSHGFSTDEVLFIGDAMTDYSAATHHGVDFYLRETSYNDETFEKLANIKYRSRDMFLLNQVLRKK